MTALRGLYTACGKRALDIVVSTIALLVLLPLLGVVYLLVRWDVGRPVLYRHVRPSKDGVPFVLYKFRTMLDSSGSDGSLLPDQERMTRFGRFLRRTSIDELPELWNVLKGDMSLVGPRPLLMEYLKGYTPYEARRHEVKAGMTGWAQVNGRNEIRFVERFRLDVWYVDNLSLWLDLRILGLTVWKALRREGIDQPGEMELFRSRRDR